mmetsp:Transcript_23963/g.65756  ORF Transcript_23963/g.65756 Transcript_23963/m.65756 type:complete len:316 (-) Transcript_23963:197-1144(-)
MPQILPDRLVVHQDLHVLPLKVPAQVVLHVAACLNFVAEHEGSCSCVFTQGLPKGLQLTLCAALQGDVIPSTAVYQLLLQACCSAVQPRARGHGHIRPLSHQLLRRLLRQSGSHKHVAQRAGCHRTQGGDLVCKACGVTHEHVHLVQHHSLGGIQVHVASRQVLGKAAGRADHHVHATSKRLPLCAEALVALLLVSLATSHSSHAHAGTGIAQRLCHSIHLLDELCGGCQYYCTRAARLCVGLAHGSILRPNGLNKGQQVRKRLAAACLVGHNEMQGLLLGPCLQHGFLHMRWARNAKLSQRSHHISLQAQPTPV